MKTGSLQLARMIATGRQALGIETTTSSEVIRLIVEDYNRLSVGNFSKSLDALDDFTIKKDGAKKTKVIAPEMSLVKAAIELDGPVGRTKKAKLKADFAGVKMDRDARKIYNELLGGAAPPPPPWDPGDHPIVALYSVAIRDAIENGDRVLFYVSHDRHFTATATATSSYVETEDSVWEKEGSAEWPYQIKIKPEIVLDDHQYMDANMIAPRLDYVKRWPPENWYMAFQGNLHLLPKSDFLLIEEEMKKLKFGKDHKRGTLAPPQDAPRRRRKRGPARLGVVQTPANAEPNPISTAPA